MPGTKPQTEPHAHAQWEFPRQLRAFSEPQNILEVCFSRKPCRDAENWWFYRIRVPRARARAGDATCAWRTSCGTRVECAGEFFNAIVGARKRAAAAAAGKTWNTINAATTVGRVAEKVYNTRVRAHETTHGDPVASGKTERPVYETAGRGPVESSRLDKDQSRVFKSVRRAHTSTLLRVKPAWLDDAKTKCFHAIARTAHGAHAERRDTIAPYNARRRRARSRNGDTRTNSRRAAISTRASRAVSRFSIARVRRSVARTRFVFRLVLSGRPGRGPIGSERATGFGWPFSYREKQFRNVAPRDSPACGRRVYRERCRVSETGSTRFPTGSSGRGREVLLKGQGRGRRARRQST